MLGTTRQYLVRQRELCVAVCCKTALSADCTSCTASSESADVTTMHTTALLALLVQSSRALSLARPRATTKRTVLRGGSTIDAAPVKRITTFVDRNFFVCGMVASVAVAGFSPGPGRGGGRFGDASLGFVRSCPYWVWASLLVSGWLRSAGLSRPPQALTQSCRSYLDSRP